MRVLGPGGDYPDNTWLRVDGVLESDGDQLKLAAGAIEEVDEPDSPTSTERDIPAPLLGDLY
ncbi:MAG: hypothetical protein GEU68_05940 [Actinobacteria bacterium]|nr:hypothetical protein [Actinomycetota bacterium]